jgi:hypothetical protein
VTGLRSEAGRKFFALSILTVGWTVFLSCLRCSIFVVRNFVCTSVLIRHAIRSIVLADANLPMGYTSKTYDATGKLMEVVKLLA